MPVHHRFTHSCSNIAIVTENVDEDLSVYISRCSHGILWHILHLNLQLHAYKTQLTKQQGSADYSERRTYEHR